MKQFTSARLAEPLLHEWTSRSAAGWLGRPHVLIGPIALLLMSFVLLLRQVPHTLGIRRPQLALSTWTFHRAALGCCAGDGRGSLRTSRPTASSASCCISGKRYSAGERSTLAQRAQAASAVPLVPAVVLALPVAAAAARRVWRRLSRPAALADELPCEETQTNPSFTITVTKAEAGPGSKVGLDVMHYESRYLQIKHIKEGAIDIYNKASTGNVVKEFDLITDINGVAGASKDLLAEIQRSKTLTFTIIRQPEAPTFGSVRCVVFDLDDTLWSTTDTLSKAHETQRAALAARCPEVEARFGDAEAFRQEMLKTMKEHPGEVDFTILRKATLSRITGDQHIAEEVFSEWFRQRNDPVFFPGAIDALRGLRDAGLKIGTLTDGNADPSRIPGLCDVVDFTVSASEAGAMKPDPRMFSLCETKAGLSSSEMVMVGDNVERDVGGAKSAGWRAVWVQPPNLNANGKSTWDYRDKTAAALHEYGEDLADAVVHHVQEVDQVLRSWANESSAS